MIAPLRRFTAELPLNRVYYYEDGNRTEFGKSRGRHIRPDDISHWSRALCDVNDGQDNADAPL